MEARLTARVVESLRRMESGCQTDLFFMGRYTRSTSKNGLRTASYTWHTHSCAEILLTSDYTVSEYKC